MSRMDADVGRKRAQEAQLEKLQKQMINLQQTMNEQTTLRKQLENLMDAETTRYEQTYERVNSRNRLLQDDLDRRSQRDASRSPGKNNNKLLEEVMSLRTKEFQRSQAKKATQMNNLIEERQRILDARNRLQEKKDVLRSLPSPVGKVTNRFWGHKYSLYSPLPFTGGARFYTPIYLSSGWGTELPVWDRSHYTYFPQTKMPSYMNKDRKVIYVPVPLRHSSYF